MTTHDDHAPRCDGVSHTHLSTPQAAPPPGHDTAGSVPLDAQKNDGGRSGGIDAHLFETRLAFSVKEAAEILGLSPKSIRRLIDRRVLRVSRALRHLRIPKSELARYLHDTLV